MKACIVAIGTEILTGETQDTNSNFLALQLAELQFPLHSIQTVRDTAPAIGEALQRAFSVADLVITTGGLGPTVDDITRKTLAGYFGQELILDQMVLSKIEAMFKVRDKDMLPMHRQQAMVPEGAEVLENNHGSAPGIWLEREGKVLCSLPGVPSEVRGIMLDEVKPRIKERFISENIAVKRLMFAGIRESHIAHKIEHIEHNLPEHIDIAYLPNYGVVKVRLTATGPDQPALEQEVERLSTQISAAAGDYLYSEKGQSLPEHIGERFTRHGLTVGTAESCTGGYVGHLITSVAGSSAYFMGSIVAYQNHLKERMLGVQADTLAQHGAVSEATVREMAIGAREKLGVDYAVSVSGIAGPGGGSDDKPVGTVWMAAASSQNVIAHKFGFTPQRDRNIKLSGIMALDMLRRLLRQDGF